MARFFVAAFVIAGALAGGLTALAPRTGGIEFGRGRATLGPALSCASSPCPARVAERLGA